MNTHIAPTKASSSTFCTVNLKNLSLLAIGYFVFSTSGDSTLRKLGIPYNLQEIWLFFLIPILKPFHYKNTYAILKTKLFLMGIIFFTVLSLIPLLRGYPAHDIFRTARPILYIFFSSIYFSRHPGDISFFNIFLIGMGAILGDLHAAYAARSIVPITGGQFLYGANVTAIFAAGSYITLNGNYKSSLFYVLATFPLVLIASFRINLFAIFFSIFFSLIFIVYLRTNIEKLFKTVIRLIAISFAFGTVFYLYLGTLATKFIFYRLSDRTLRLFTVGLKASEDDIRSNSILRYFDSIDLFNILPQGFITVAQKKIGSHYDFPISFIIDTFGLLIAIVIFLFILALLISAFQHLKNTCTIDAVTAASLYFLFFPLLLFFHGRFFYVFSEAMIFGILFGLAISSYKIHFKNFLCSPHHRQNP